MIPQSVIDAAQVAHRAFYPRGPFASVTIAQWALESGYGRFESGKNNYFGIKATAAQIAAGHATARWTREEKADGTPYSIIAYFANYDSLEDGFMTHAGLLTKPWYADCQKATTPEEYCGALEKDHYASAINYAGSLIAIIDSQNLKQYD